MKKIICRRNKYKYEIAVLKNDKMDELHIIDNETKVGNIYVGRVKEKVKGIKAIFVDIGINKNAYLYLENEKDFKYKMGDTILVQVKKDEVGEKGAYLTTDIVLKSKSIILLPDVQGIKISKKIKDKEKRELICESLNNFTNKGCGVLVRSGFDLSDIDNIKKELEYLYNLWNDIEREKHFSKPPKLVYEYDVSKFIINDLYKNNIVKIVVDDEKIYNKLFDLNIFNIEKLKLYDNNVLDVFEIYGIKKDYDNAFKRKVWLKSGGQLVIDYTEAMTVIDVNTSKFVGNKNSDKTILKTNIEACYEIARQLRIRNISGIIIIDFINMKDKGSNLKLLESLKEEVKDDSIKTFVIGMTSLGLVEVTRQRKRKRLN